MAPARIVPAFDELEDRHAGLGLALEPAPIEQFAFQGIVDRAADFAFRRQGSC